MAKKKWTEGVLCRDTGLGDAVAFIHARSHLICRQDVYLSKYLWLFEPPGYSKEWTPAEFKEIYGFLPRKGTAKEVELEL